VKFVLVAGLAHSAHKCATDVYIVTVLMSPTVGKGAISVAFVHPSVVCPSIAYIVNNLRMQRPSMLKFEGRFLTLDATSVPVSGSNGQQSELQAGGGIPCQPNPVATPLV